MFDEELFDPQIFLLEGEVTRTIPFWPGNGWTLAYRYAARAYKQIFGHG